MLLLLQHCHNFERNEFLIPCWTVRTAAHGFSFEILIVNIIEKKIIITNIDKSTVHPQIVQEENRISFWKTLWTNTWYILSVFVWKKTLEKLIIIIIHWPFNIKYIHSILKNWLKNSKVNIVKRHNAIFIWNGFTMEWIELHIGVLLNRIYFN